MNVLKNLFTKRNYWKFSYTARELSSDRCIESGYFAVFGLTKEQAEQDGVATVKRWMNNRYEVNSPLNIAYSVRRLNLLDKLIQL